MISHHLQLFPLRHSLSVGMSVLTAVIMDHYFSFSHEFWIVLSAFLVSQTTRGTALKQSIVILVTIMAAILFSTLLWEVIKIPMMVYGILSLIVITNGYLSFIDHPIASKNHFVGMIFTTLLLISTLLPFDLSSSAENRVLDVLMGGILAIFWGQVVFPVRLYQEFGQGLVPLFHAMANYAGELSQYFAKHHEDISRVHEKKLAIEQVLQSQQGLYPDWVYEIGFNPGLSSGFRFFLINLDYISEICFSLDYLVTRKIAIPQALSQAISHTMQENQGILKGLATYFDKNEIKTIDSNLTEDIAALENELSQFVPRQLEFLEVAPEYLDLMALVRNVKDMRELLLRLLMALPNA